MERLWIGMAGGSGFVAVAAGAFGAHGLSSAAPPALVQVFETAARYQMYHALALLLVGVLAARGRGAALAVAGWSFVIGTILFSGSLYLLALTGLRGLGAITPLGGAAFLVGWASLAWGGVQGAGLRASETGGQP